MRLAIFFFVSRILDLFTTQFLLSRGGEETNPIAAWQIDNLGVYGIFLVSYLLSFIVYTLSRIFDDSRTIRDILWMLTFFGLVISGYNLLLAIFAT